MNMLRGSILQLLKVGQIGFSRSQLILRPSNELFISCSFGKKLTYQNLVYKVDSHEVSDPRLVRPVLRLGDRFKMGSSTSFPLLWHWSSNTMSQ